MLQESKKHLHSVHENYFQHMAFALRVSFVLVTAAVLLLLHAFLPAIFQCSASKRIFKLADEIRARQNADKNCDHHS